MLGMFDVLGFSDRLKAKGLEGMFELYESLVRDVIVKEPLRCLGTRSMDGNSYPILFSADIRYAYFSDTILLWMPLDRLFVGPFVQRCADLVCEALSIGIPLRGAIALGEGFLHKGSSTYLGELIVEAHRLEAAQDWMGVGFCPSAAWDQFLAELNPKQIIEYEPPVKPGRESFRSPVSLDWPRCWRERFNTSPASKLLELNNSPTHAKYYENALAFANFSEKHHDWFDHPDKLPHNAKLRMKQFGT